MSRRAIFLLIMGGMAGASGMACAPIAVRDQPARAPASYLFAYFAGNGQDGLHLASSNDAKRFVPLKSGQSFLTPTLGGKLMRDPSIVSGPDGTYHLVWTTGWWDKGIGLAHSKDLVRWSDQEWLPVMEQEPTALNCWAPEIFYDAPTSRYLIFWATTIPGRFRETEAFGDEVKETGARLNHRIYYVTTTDFRSYSTAKLFYDGGFNVIDATLVRDGGLYRLFVKDETRYPAPRKNIRMATAERADGPFRDLSMPITIDWVEGPSVLKTPGGWTLFYDEYTRHRYGAVTSTDLKRWDAIATPLSFPDGARHGTVFEAPRRLVQSIDSSPR